MNPRLKAAQDAHQKNLSRLAELRNKTEHDEAEAKDYAALTEGDALALSQAAIDREIKADKLFTEQNNYLNGNGALGAIAPSLHAQDDPEARFLAVKMSRSPAKFFSLIEGNKIKAQEKAHRFGQFLGAALLKRPSAIKFCNANGIPLAGQTEGVNEDGGFLVPPEFEWDMIDLREQFGMFRQFARISPMASDRKLRPGRKNGLTAYFVGEAEAADDSKKNWYQIELVAKDLMVLTKYSNDLGDDAAIALGDDIAGEMAYAHAKKEDQCGFIGDGTSTYGRIVGVTNRLTTKYTSTSVSSTGVQIASGNNWSEITLGDFQALTGKLPPYAEGPNVAWYCSKQFFETVMVRLMLAAGGATAQEILAGLRRQFMGVPVRITQVMPTAEANSQVPVIYGDLRLTADFGDRRATSVAMSEHANFETNEMTVRGIERFDINVHGIGVSSDGDPMVGLRMAAS